MIYLPGLGGTKELMLPYLQDLAASGFVALSFDPWQHGERGTESQTEIWTRVFGNFQRHMWPILGQTTLDMLRVIDWAVATLHIEPHISVGGLSMGGDIAVAAAGLDHRVERVAAIIGRLIGYVRACKISSTLVQYCLQVNLMPMLNISMTTSIP